MNLIQTPNKQSVDDDRRTPSTPIPAWWLNQLQDELYSILNAIDIEPNEAGRAQVLSAIKTLVADVSQVASIDALRRYSDTGYVNINAYHANTTVGSGVFVADKVDKPTADNGCTVTVSTDGTYWKRVFSGVLNLYDSDYVASKNSALATLSAAETTTLSIVTDCLGLSVDTGSNCPQENKYTNGEFAISGKTVDVQYRAIRNGIGRFIVGGSAAANLKSGGWTEAGVVVIGEGAMGKTEKCVLAIVIDNRAQGFSRISRDNISAGADSLISVQADTEWYDQSKLSRARNIGIGGNAGRSTTSGSSNMAVGRNPGQGIGAGSSNIALGAASLTDTTPIGLVGDIEVFWPSPTSPTVTIGEAVLQMYQSQDAQTTVGGSAAKNAKAAEETAVVGASVPENLERNRAPNDGDVLWRGTENGSYVQDGHNITLNFGNTRDAQVGCWVDIRLTSSEAITVRDDVVPVEVTATADNSLAIRSPKELNASGNTELRYIYSTSSVAAKNEELTVIGTNALKSAVSGAYTTVVGVDAMSSSDNPQKTVTIGASALRNGTHLSSMALECWRAPTISNEQSVFIGDSANYRNIQGGVLSGKITNSIAVGCGTRLSDSNEIQLGVLNQIPCTPSAISIRSDARDKADIKPLSLGLDFVNKLKPATGVHDRRDAYADELFTDLPQGERTERLWERWKNPTKDGRYKEDRIQHWFTAQDVAVSEAEYGMLPMINFRQDTYTIEYEMFMPVLTKAIQEMAARIETLETEIKELKK